MKRNVELEGSGSQG